VFQDGTFEDFYDGFITQQELRKERTNKGEPKYNVKTRNRTNPNRLVCKGKSHQTQADAYAVKQEK
jgi:hypothetical protein